MADMTTIKGRIAETIYPNGKGAITAEKHQALLLEMVDDINAKKADKEEVTAVAESVSTLSQEVESNYNSFTKSLDALEQKVDNLPQGDVFDKEGNYPLLHVGTADTAIDLAGRGESVPAEFSFRASGGKSIKDGRAYIKRIKGNSVVWNQMVSDTMYLLASKYEGQVVGGKYVGKNKEAMLVQNSGITVRDYYTIIGHKYLWIFTCSNANCRASVGDKYSLNSGVITEATSVGRLNIYPYGASSKNIEAGTEFELTAQVHDLTQMFSAGKEPTTIEEFYARVATLGVDLNAYNEGEVIHCNTESIKSVGDNAWDEEWEVGSYDTKTGQPLVNNDAIRTKDKMRILGGMEYYTKTPNASTFAHFYDIDGNLIRNVTGTYHYMEIGNKKWTSPQNAAYMTFYIIGQSTYNHDIMITLVHSGWKQDTDAGYQPYWQDTLPLPIIRNYFPDGMKLAGSAHDEIRFNKASGKWEYSKGKIKSVDMGTLNWGLTSQMYFRANLPSDSIIPTSVNYNGFLCAKYERVNFNLIYGQSVTTPCFGVSANNGMIGVYDSSYTDAATFKAAMQGVMLYYESNDWEWVELDAEDQNFRDYYNVADFGTEEAIPATDAEGNIIPSANFSADIIYQFNAVDMIREHEIEITELQQVIATMQAQLTSLINGGQ